MINLTNITYRWHRKSEDCIDIASLQIAQGERVFLQGASGSGKSTLLGLLAGVNLPQKGVIEILGENILRLSNSQRDSFRADHIGFIFQQFNLLPWLSALDNVLLPCTFSPRRKSLLKNPQEEASRLLRQLDLHHSLWQKPAAELSVGQQQRVAAARALIGKPEIIIADEPTSALDAKLQNIFVDLLLAETTAVNATLLFVSHDIRLAENFPRQIILTEINRVQIEATL